MILKYISKSGNKIYGPPYTTAKLADFYSRNANGPVTIARGRHFELPATGNIFGL